MCRRLLIPVVLAMLVMGVAQAFAQTVTVVTQSGQRIRGQLIEMGNGRDLTVRVNGRDRQIVVDDIEVVDFVGDGRNLPQNESTSSQNNEGMVVLRNGRTHCGTP